jgi:1,2-diacylglycerol 3-beta-glucosyltransferase
MTEPRATTPGRWRAAAIIALAGGAGVGYRASARGGVAGRIVAAGLGVGLASTVRVAAASRRPPIPPGAAPLDASAPPPTFSIIVAARDEAAVLPRLIADIARQDYRTSGGRPLFEVVIVDDRSVDGTPQAALRAAAAEGLGAVTKLVRRAGEDLADGKGAALTAVPPETCHGDVIVVLDADARVGPRFLATLATYIAAGAGAVTVRRRVLRAGGSALAGAQADEQLADGEIQRGRWALGGCSEFRGNGIVVRRDLLMSVGGWRAEALTEDLDLSSRLAAVHGVTVAWAIDAEVWEEPVDALPSLWRQRVRWAEGAIRRVLEHGPSVVRSPRLSIGARIDFVGYAGQLLAPPIIIGSLAGAVRHRRSAVAAALLGGYAVTAAAIGFDALRWEPGPDGGPLPVAERLHRALRVTWFGAIWLAAVPAALWRLAIRGGPVRYDKMAHDGGGESFSPELDAFYQRHSEGAAAGLPR